MEKHDSNNGKFKSGQNEFGEKEETGFSQPIEHEDENGAGGSLGHSDSDLPESDDPGTDSITKDDAASQ